MFGCCFVSVGRCFLVGCSWRTFLGGMFLVEFGYGCGFAGVNVFLVDVSLVYFQVGWFSSWWIP